MNKTPKRVLILTSDAGLGHLSAANALRDAFKSSYEDACDIQISNPFSHPDIPELFRHSQSNYDEIVKEMPELYEFAYEISDSKFPVSVIEGGFTLIFYRIFKRIVENFNPDLVITTYPIYPAPIAALSQIEEMNFPWIIAVTDFATVHHLWFNDAATLCIVPTEAVEEIAKDAGLKSDQILKIGIPVDPKISILKEHKKEILRKELGWDKHKRTLLVVGSPRMENLMSFIHALDGSNHDFQFALVAGGNDDIYQNFEDASLNHPANVYNFVENLPEMMRASDMIICKAGGLIITESLASGLPLMLIKMLPGQEEGNVEYILEHQAGDFCDTPEKARRTLDDWLADNGKKLKNISNNAAEIGKPDAAEQIAEKAWEIMNR